MACLFFLLSMMPLKEGDIKIPFPDLSRHGKWEYKQTKQTNPLRSSQKREAVISLRRERPYRNNRQVALLFYVLSMNECM